MNNKRPLILISNDDGITAKGIEALTEVARNIGDVIVVAPNSAQSGMSHAITVKVPLHLKIIEESKEFTKYSCNGTPADCIKLALHKICSRKPDLVLSGINHGSNAATSIIYSGTMAAVLEGCMNQIPAIGFSILDYSETPDFSASKVYIEKIINLVLKNKLPEKTCLNVNIPKASLSEIKGVRVCRQDDGQWIEEFDERINPSKQTYFWLTGEYHSFEPDSEQTDEWALKNNFISVVPVKYDFTNNSAIDTISKWDF